MRILFIGGDSRMEYAALKLAKTHEISRFGSDCRGVFDAIVLPLPLTKDGKTITIPNCSPMTFEELGEIVGGVADEHTLVLAGGECSALVDVCERSGCGLVNYFASETLTLQNAALTAEAAMCLLSQSGDGALLGSEALILGSGRIAVFLGERLRACGARVTFAARSADKRALLRLNGFSAIPLEELRERLCEFDYAANTIPVPLFCEEMFSAMKKRAVFMELATLPDQKELAERSEINYIFAGGLPGRYSPKAAGEFIAETVEEIIKSRSADRSALAAKYSLI